MKSFILNVLKNNNSIKLRPPGITLYKPLTKFTTSYLFLVSIFLLSLLAPLTDLVLTVVNIDSARIHYFTPSSKEVFVAFIPEVVLAVMITYLIAIAAVELANNRPPKVLAIDC